MRVAFMGTAAFALPSLQMLHDRHEVIAVYTRPDAASGRGRRVSPSPVKMLAEELGLPLAQPASLRSPEEAAALTAMSLDLIVVAAYGLLLPGPALRSPRIGCLNVHASLLPFWRGAAPIERAILAGDDQAGVSIMAMEEGLDTGPFAAQRGVGVDRKTAVELTQDLASLGAAALSDVIDEVERGTVEWTPQDETLATYAQKMSASDVELDPALTTADADRRVRASSRRTPSKLVIGGRLVTVHAVRPSPAGVGAGLALCSGGVTLGFADGALEVTSLVPAGRSPMSGEDYARGAHLPGTCVWGAA